MTDETLTVSISQEDSLSITAYPLHLNRLLVACKLAPSRSDAQRKIKAGAVQVHLNGYDEGDWAEIEPNFTVWVCPDDNPLTIRCGRRWVRVDINWSPSRVPLRRKDPTGTPTP